MPFPLTLKTISLFLLATDLPAFTTQYMDSMTQLIQQPDKIYFKDDGTIPNSVFPLLFYSHAFIPEAENLASVMEKRFKENTWTGSWRGGVYPFHHYHSTSHEVLGVFEGAAMLQFGGEKGQTFHVRPGDVVVIPAGVAHKKIDSSDNFRVIGAYPDGRSWDLLQGLPGERPLADHNIDIVPIPKNDPIYGRHGPLKKLWKVQSSG